MSAGAILVIGVGGIGGPAAMALARPSSPPLRLVDPDVVETSNLPRQVLFTADDVGQRKALVAARRLNSRGIPVEGIVDRFDESSAARLLEGVAVAIDATDGAGTKDLVNAIVVEAGIALIHAAAIQSEARLLEIPAGGGPCIACVFGYPSESADGAGDTCARIGVWPAVPGAIGALAADAALRRIDHPRSPSNGLQVLDFAIPRALALSVRADPACPACGRARRRPRPVVDPCASGSEPFDDTPPDAVLDLRLEHCPMNLFRARAAIEKASVSDLLEIWVGSEGAETVPSGLSALGHRVLLAEPREGGLRLIVRRGGGPAAAVRDEDWQRRFARQIVLPDFGEEGQRRIAAADVVVNGHTEAARTAALHLAAAGVGSIVQERRPRPGHSFLEGPMAWIDRSVRLRGPLSRFEGAVAADALLRSIVSRTIAANRIGVSDAGVVGTESSVT